MKKILPVLIVLLLVFASTVVLAEHNYEDDHEANDDYYSSTSRNTDDDNDYDGDTVYDDDDDWDVSNDFFLEHPVVKELGTDPIVIEPLVVENNQTQEDKKIKSFVDLHEKISLYKNSSKNISTVLNQTSLSQNNTLEEHLVVSEIKQITFIQRFIQYFFGGKK